MTPHQSFLRPDKEAYKLFHEATLALSQIEENGIRVDVAYLEKTIEATKERVKQLKQELRADPIFKEWKKRFGDKTKLTAHNQLGTMIFDVMKHERAYVVKKRDKSEFVRSYEDEEESESNSEAAFADVDLPFVKNWFEMKRLEDKALKTYFAGIIRETVDGYCHPFFNLHTTVSFRSSSDRFNFQNIPKRNPELAEMIRRCFIASDGFHFGEVDYSQAEVRGAAVYSHDKNLIKYVKDRNSDMHRDTACDLFFLDHDFFKVKDKNNSGIRHTAKNMFVFPEFYGATWFQQAPMMWAEIRRRGFTFGRDTLVKHLAKNGIKELGECKPQSTPKAGTFAAHVMRAEREMWDKRFQIYRDWKKKWWNDYQRTGGFKFKTGFVCNSFLIRNEVLSLAIQGTAFHWMLWSLVVIQRWLRKNRMKTKIVGQIHDSIVADIHPKEKDDFLHKCQEVMTKDIVKHWPWIDVIPLEVEAEVSPVNGSWFDLKEEKL